MKKAFPTVFRFYVVSILHPQSLDSAYELNVKGYSGLLVSKVDVSRF